MDTFFRRVLPMNQRWWLPLLASLLIIFVGFSIILPNLRPSLCVCKNAPTYIFPEVPNAPLEPKLALPRLAYLISGTRGDGMRIQRTLQALYHPRNYYVLHLDLKASPEERKDLNRYISNQPLFQKVKNVLMIKKANLVTYRGPTMVAETLHGASVLLKNFTDWDWFINLSASDYPLVTQDDILQVFSSLPRDLNFIEHTTDLGWKYQGRAQPIIVDPALYLTHGIDGNIVETHFLRDLPTTFTLFTGSAWAVLSRSFMEYTIMGWDNLPRVLLMYYTNFVSTPEGYFHTVICNTDEYKYTTVNHDLHYITWDIPPKQHPLSLSMEDFKNMTQSGAPFARKFKKEDPVLAQIDKELLGRASGNFTPGGWCVDSLCTETGVLNFLQPGPGAKRFQSLLGPLLEKSKLGSDHCVI